MLFEAFLISMLTFTATVFLIWRIRQRPSRASGPTAGIEEEGLRLDGWRASKGERGGGDVGTLNRRGPDSEKRKGHDGAYRR